MLQLLSEAFAHECLENALPVVSDNVSSLSTVLSDPVNTASGEATAVLVEDDVATGNSALASTNDTAIDGASSMTSYPVNSTSSGDNSIVTDAVNHEAAVVSTEGTTGSPVLASAQDAGVHELSSVISSVVHVADKQSLSGARGVKRSADASSVYTLCAKIFYGKSSDGGTSRMKRQRRLPSRLQD